MAGTERQNGAESPRGLLRRPERADGGRGEDCENGVTVLGRWAGDRSKWREFKFRG